MRIAQVCPLFFPYRGGVETHVEEVSKRLAKNNAVDVLTTDPMGIAQEKHIAQGVKVMYFRAFAFWGIYFAPGLHKFLKKNSKDYDIVHVHDYNSIQPYYAAKSKTNNKLVFSPHFHGIVGHTFFHSLLHIPYKYFLGKKIFGKADLVICGSDFERRKIRGVFSNVEEKCCLINEAPSLDNLQEIKSSRPFNRENKIIFCVSRIEKYKGIQYIVKALKYLPSSVLLHIVGKGPYRSNLEKLVKDLCLQDRVIFSEDLTKRELFQCYASADVGVLLSSHEMFSLFIAESLASGMPCVVANTSGLSEWIDGENCLGVNHPKDINKVAETIQTALNGRVAEVNVSNWDEYVQNLQNLYETLVRGSSKHLQF